MMITTDSVLLKETLKNIDLSKFRPRNRTSMFYLVVDIILIVLALAITHTTVTNEYYLLSFIFSLIIGNLFFSLFVLGHDCGHGSFSNSKSINNLVGFALHHFILTPYWSWKRSHQKHHRFAGNIEKDESFVPFSEDDAKSFLGVRKNNKMSFLRIRLFNLFTFFTGLNFHLYTIYNPRTKCSHFIPNRVFFKKSDDKWIYFGTACSLVYFATLVSLTVQFPAVMFFLYWLPFMVCYHILSFVTLMQHHHDDSTWYYPKDWERLKGTLNTFDYRYGVFNFLLSKLHHNIAHFHVTHHIFSSIPHYELEAATRDIVGHSDSEYKPKNFSYASYIKIIWSSNYVENEEHNSGAYTLKSFEQL